MWRWGAILIGAGGYLAWKMAKRRTVYWIDYCEETKIGPIIHRAALSEAGTLGTVEDYYTFTDEGSPAGGGLGIARDLDGTLYATKWNNLWRIPSSKDAKTLDVKPFVPTGVAVDSKNRFLYWADSKPDGAIYRAPLKDSIPDLTLKSCFAKDISRPNSLKIVFDGGKTFLYWTLGDDSEGRLVQRRAVNSTEPTSNSETVVKVAATSDNKPAGGGVAVDPKRRVLFWVQAGQDTISIASLDRKLPILQPDKVIPNLGSKNRYLEWDAKNDRLLLGVERDSVSTSELAAIKICGLENIGPVKVLIKGYHLHELIVV